MSSTSNILSYTEYQSEVTRKISVANITRIFDATTYRAIELVGGDKLKSSDSYATIKQEAVVLFEATDSKVGTALYNSYLIDKLSVNGSGTDIIYNGGIEYLVSEDIDIVEERIDAINEFFPIVDPTAPIELTTGYNRIDNQGTFTIPQASEYYNGNNIYTIEIKNVSGGLITIVRSSTDTFYSATPNTALTQFSLQDGEYIRLTCGSSSVWDIN